MKSRKRRFMSAALCMFVAFFVLSSQINAVTIQESYPKSVPYLNTIQSGIVIPQAPGEIVFEESGVLIDASNTSDGYVGVSCVAPDKDLKVQILTPNNVEYIYFLDNQGIAEFFPFSEGSGEYTVSVYYRLSGFTHALLYSVPLYVDMHSSLSPFLYPNQQINYSQDSDIVAVSNFLAKDHDGTKDIVDALYHYVGQSITFDYEKVREVLNEELDPRYIPDPDVILFEGTGICYDYAVLLAAMLRIQGIPTRLVKGWALRPNTTEYIYHAWNEVWLDGQWVLYDATLYELSDEVHYESLLYF